MEEKSIIKKSSILIVRKSMEEKSIIKKSSIFIARKSMEENIKIDILSILKMIFQKFRI
ncbi:hypothetical protein [Helcococcus bovis]|uniref:Uncharacterized protein n=2 Tax=Helcococcus TaxID=31983 RepID=A0ABW9F495_9FIRM